MAGRPQKQTQKRENVYNRAEPPSPAREDPYAAGDIPLLEWIVGAVGFVLVTAVIVFVLYEAITGSQSPPDIRVSVRSVLPLRNGYLVNLEAVNQGGATAAGVVLEAELRQGSELFERSHVTLDYSPPGSAKRAGLFFTRDPRQFDLQVRALGFEEP